MHNKRRSRSCFLRQHDGCRRYVIGNQFKIMKYSIRENHQEQLELIWANKDFKDIEVLSRGYHTVEFIIKNSILFIGINPSYSENRNPINHNAFNCIKQESNEYSKYFRPFENIAKSVGSKWSHLDILFFQETSQKYIDKLLKTDIGFNFIQAQLQVTKQILENSSPLCIIVCNTKAREFLGKHTKENKWLNYSFKFDDKLGTDRIHNENSNLHNTPIFFSSMLSGTRALDIGSRERLIWQIKRTINQLK